MAQRIDAEVHVGSQGRVVIPSSMRKALHLKAGDTLTARIEEGRLVLERREDVLARLKKRYSVLPREVSLVQDLVAERRVEGQRERG